MFIHTGSSAGQRAVGGGEARNSLSASSSSSSLELDDDPTAATVVGSGICILVR